MATVTIRRLDETIKAKLRIRAAQHGRSMEEEAREIIRQAVISVESGQPDLVTSIRRRFGRFGGVELPEIPREPIRKPPKFE